MSLRLDPPSTTPRSQFTDSIDRWVEAGLISAAQGQAIRRAEAERAGAPPPQPRRFPLITEVLGYVGAILAFAAGGVLLGDHWEQLSSAAHIAIMATVTGALLAGGWLIRDADEPALQRFAGGLWLLSTGAFCGLMINIAADLWKPSSEAAAVAVSGSTAAYATALWVWRRRELQLIPVAAAGLATAGSIAALAGASPVGISLAVWGFGLAWFLAAWRGALQPLPAAYVLGALPLLIAPWPASAVADWALFVGLASAAGLMGASVPLRQTPVLFLGAIGLFAFVTRIVVLYFADTIGAPMALLLAGVVMIGIALVTARLYRTSPRNGAPRA